MRLTDFDIGAFGTYPESDRIALNRRAAHISEAIRYTLCQRPLLEARFGKIFANLTPDPVAGERRVRMMLDVAMVSTSLRQGALSMPYVAFRSAILDSAEAAFRSLEEELKWKCPRFWEALPELRAATEPIFRARLALSKTQKGGRRRADVFYEIDESSTRMRVVVSDDQGRVIREDVVADHPKPAPLQLLFPVKSTKVVGNDLVFFDSEKKELARVAL